jgi:copper homeostasis protein
MTLLEVCLEDAAAAAIAEHCGADRIELCTDLAHGGTTPPLATVTSVLGSVRHIGLQVLIRLRPGDFVYSAEEVTTMVGQIEAIARLPRPAGVTLGFVVGALTPAGRIDIPATTRLRAACGSAPVTFHRAFDELPDQSAGLDSLIALGFDRVLTSGGGLTASAGAAELAGLVQQAGDRICVLAAGSVRAHNVADLIRRTGVREVHLRAVEPASTTTSATVVRAVIAELKGPQLEHFRPID